MFKATRHPFERFEETALGESTRAAFGADDRVQVAAMDPGGSVEPGSGIDATVRTTPTLYFRGSTPPWSAHDEWTVSGQRYAADGEPAVWASPWTGEVAGVVVRLKRRTG